MLGEGGLQALGQVPCEDVRADVSARLVPELAELVDAFKVRSYARSDGDQVEIEGSSAVSVGDRANWLGRAW